MSDIGSGGVKFPEPQVVEQYSVRMMQLSREIYDKYCDFLKELQDLEFEFLEADSRAKTTVEEKYEEASYLMADSECEDNDGDDSYYVEEIDRIRVWTENIREADEVMRTAYSELKQYMDDAKVGAGIEILVPKLAEMSATMERLANRLMQI